MASIPTYNYNNDVNRFKYLEKVDKTPDFKDPALYKKADSFIKYRNHSVKKETSGDKLKAAVGSILGTIIPMAFMMKKQGVKNPLKLKYGLRDMLVLSAAPIIGGVSVGMIGNNAETNYGKSREGVFQFFNAAIPADISLLTHPNDSIGQTILRQYSINASNTPNVILLFITNTPPKKAIIIGNNLLANWKYGKYFVKHFDCSIFNS